MKHMYYAHIKHTIYAHTHTGTKRHLMGYIVESVLCTKFDTAFTCSFINEGKISCKSLTNHL